MSDWMTAAILVCIAISAARITIALNKIQRDEMTINEWKNDFKSYINTIMLPRDDYNGIMDYIDECPAKDSQDEPVMMVDIADSVDGIEVGICPACGKSLVNDLKKPTKYCKYCGKSVKWNE